MTRFYVHTRAAIRTIFPRSAYIIIGIRSPGADRVSYPANERCAGILELAFDDIDQAGAVLLRPDAPEVLFDDALADQIIDFWLAHRDVAEIHVHCDAGSCRSPAVAAALQKLAGDDDSVWFATKSPNRKVYRTLLNRAMDRGLLA